MKKFAALLVATAAALTLTATPASAWNGSRPTALTLTANPEGGHYDLVVESDRPGAIVTSTATPGVCSVERDRVEVLGAGVCTVVAEQAATWLYQAGHAETSFTVR